MDTLVRIENKRISPEVYHTPAVVFGLISSIEELKEWWMIEHNATEISYYFINEKNSPLIDESHLSCILIDLIDIISDEEDKMFVILQEPVDRILNVYFLPIENVSAAFIEFLNTDLIDDDVEL